MADRKWLLALAFELRVIDIIAKFSADAMGCFHWMSEVLFSAWAQQGGQ